MMWWPFGGFGWGIMGIFGLIWMVLIWGGIIALIVWAVRRAGRSHAPYAQSPLDIAKERYARGEITKEQFEQIKKDLSS